MGCNCGKPKYDGHCGASPAVLQINNPSECTLFHRVEVPASLGDSKTNPPKNGEHRNTLLFYEADQTSWLYSSDGIPTKITGATSDYAVTHLIPIIEDGAVWDEWQQTGDLIYATWELLSCDKVSFNVSGTSETMSLQEVFDALENGTEYVFDSLPLDEVDPVILGSNPPEYPEVSGVAVPSRQSFSYVAGPDPATDTINVVFRSGSVESVLIPYNDSPKVCKVMTGVLRQDQTGVESKYLFMLGRVVSPAPIG